MSKMNILEKANSIIYQGAEGRRRMYGDFQETMEKTAKIASLIGTRDYSAKDAFVILMAMKLARESHSHKEDNLLDLIGYAAGYNDLLNNLENEIQKSPTVD